MHIPKSNLYHRRAVSLAICFTLCSALFLMADSNANRNPEKAANGLAPVRLNILFRGRWEKRFALQRGETFELSVGLPSPSSLPRHGRVGVRWTLVEEKKESGAATSFPALFARKPDAFGVYTQPTADWKKVLHALDPDVYLVYRAPVTGLYALEIAPVTDEATVFEGARRREDGFAPQAVVFPRVTPWPAGKSVPLSVTIQPLGPLGPLGPLELNAETGMRVETEPNDTPEMAQEIALPEGDGVQAVRITGGADDVE